MRLCQYTFTPMASTPKIPAMCSCTNNTANTTTTGRRQLVLGTTHQTCLFYYTTSHFYISVIPLFTFMTCSLPRAGKISHFPCYRSGHSRSRRTNQTQPICVHDPDPSLVLFQDACREAGLSLSASARLPPSTDRHPHSSGPRLASASRSLARELRGLAAAGPRDHRR